MIIIYLGLERDEIDAGDVEWRGVVEQMPGGDLCHVHRLSDLMACIEPYLMSLGAKHDER